MKIEQRVWSNSGWVEKSSNLDEEANFVLAFGCKKALSEPNKYDEIKSFYPDADIVLCSTAGEIAGTLVTESCVNLTAIKFESTAFSCHRINIGDFDDSFQAGEKIANSLEKEELIYVMILSDGQLVNGSELVKALAENLGNEVIITGGLAGDGAEFKSTLVGLNESAIEGNIVAIGFYGDNLTIGHASKGGWDAFGPERLITKSKSNVLFELDGQPALDLYKKYLGEMVNELPGSALNFPMSVKLEGTDFPLVRTILSIDEEKKSMTFAGDMPEGCIARMMKSNFERLIDAASSAASSSVKEFGSFDPDLALLVSCAGRRFVLQDKVDHEIEKVREVLGDQTVISGFYSYGEISPVVKSTRCELHNQTMTITTLKEE